jgi:hypothetical protein
MAPMAVDAKCANTLKSASRRAPLAGQLSRPEATAFTEKSTEHVDIENAAVGIIPVYVGLHKMASPGVVKPKVLVPTASSDLFRLDGSGFAPPGRLMAVALSRFDKSFFRQKQNTKLFISGTAAHAFLRAQ